MQMCRRHHRLATDIEIISSGSQSTIYDQLATEFSHKILSKFIEPQVLTDFNKEEVKKSDNPEIETEEQLLEIMDTYEKGFKERAQKREQMLEKKREEDSLV